MGGLQGESKCCLESRELGGQEVLVSDLVLPIHGHMTLGRFYVNFVRLSFFIREMGGDPAYLTGLLGGSSDSGMPIPKEALNFIFFL